MENNVESKTICNDTNNIDKKKSSKIDISTKTEKIKGSTINFSSLFSEQNSTTNTNLYVCNIPEKWNIKELESLFTQYGKVVSCRIMYDKYTGQSRRIGFVKFDTRQQSDDALKFLNGKLPKLPNCNSTVSDKPLVVKYANNSNYLSILTSIAADIAAVHGINPNEILAHISQLYFPHGSNVPSMPLSKQRKNLSELIEVKLKTYFGCDGNELFRNEIKSNSKENLTINSSNKQNIATAATTTTTANNNNNNNRNATNGNYIIPLQKKVSNQQILPPSIEIQNKTIPIQYQHFIPYQQKQPIHQQQYHQSQQQFLKQLPIRNGWPIYVHNLPTKCDECVLWKLFNPFGPVLYVHINRDNKNKCKGFGIVTMTNYEQAVQSVCVLNGLSLPGSNKPLQVQLKTINF